MAIRSQTAGYFNTGKDISLAITYSQNTAAVNAPGQTNAFGGLPATSLQIENIMEFEYRQVVHDVTVTMINNETLVADLPDRWEGTFTWLRGSSDVDQSVAAVEQLWKDQAGDFLLGTVTMIISSTQENTTITFYDATFRLEDAGTWKGDDTVRCRLAFRAGRRKIG